MLLQVKRALTLVKDNVINDDNIKSSWPKIPTLPKSVNANTGKESTTAVAFNDDGWGDATRGFTELAALVASSNHKFDKLEREAKELSRGNTRVYESLSSTQDKTDGGEFAELLQNYDSENDSSEEGVSDCDDDGHNEGGDYDDGNDYGSDADGGDADGGDDDCDNEDSD